MLRCHEFFETEETAVIIRVLILSLRHLGCRVVFVVELNNTEPAFVQVEVDICPELFPNGHAE